MDPEARFSQNPSFIYRNIAGEAILVPIRRRVGDLESIITLNETGARIWQLLDGQNALKDVCAVITSEYDISPEIAEHDLEELILQLLELGAVEKTL